MPRSTADWDGAKYHRLAAPQEEWARSVLARMDLKGGETVLDAGCGSGRATKLLLERLPRGRVIGVDGSPSMLEEARKTLAPWADRVELILADLVELELPERVDAIFSNATFHWIKDHDRLFRGLRAALKTGGSLVAQCGGQGNVAELTEAIERAGALPEFAPSFAERELPHHFAGPAETEERLARAGFADIRCGLEERVVQVDSPREFVAAVALAPLRERLSEAQRDAFTDAVLEGLQKPVVFHYVRLNIDARAA